MPRRPASTAPAGVGPRLLALIRADGRSMRAVAAAAGTYPANLSRICKGATEPTAETLAKILHTLGKGWGDLDAR